MMPETDEELQELQEKATREMERLKPVITYALDTYYKKPYILECRVKSTEKLKLKQALLSSVKGKPQAITSLLDIVGFRIGVETEEDVVELANVMLNYLEPYQAKDSFTQPSEGGFKAYLLHLDTLANGVGVNTEVQMMTMQMMEFANATHEEYDEKKYGRHK